MVRLLDARWKEIVLEGSFYSVRLCHKRKDIDRVFIAAFCEASGGFLLPQSRDKCNSMDPCSSPGQVSKQTQSKRMIYFKGFIARGNDVFYCIFQVKCIKAAEN